MFPTLQIGPLSLATPGLILLIGLWIGLTVAEKRAQNHQVDPNRLYNLVMWIFIAGILGARLSYVVRFPQAFLENPVSLLSLNPGLFDPLAGAGVGVLALLIYAQRSGLNVWRVLDALTPALAIFSFAVAFSQLASGSAYGLPTSLPWGIDLWNASRHPTQIYAMLAAASIFIWVWFSQGKASSQPAGTLFWHFATLTAAAALIIAGFRADSPTLVAGIRTEQLIAWLVFALGLVSSR